MNGRLFALLACMSMACDDGGAPAAGESGVCAPAPLAAQPRSRFVEGGTFWLSRPAACAEPWSLVEAPTQNANAVVAGADGHDRFTPVVQGTYRFELPGTDFEDAITVVSSQSRSFHNFNYYPGASLAEVGAEIWVADVTRPTVTRLSTDLEVIAGLPVGGWPVAVAWRPGAPFAVVAQRADDTLGLIDVEANRLTDAIWVGDEPSNVVMAPGGRVAYVALATEAAVAVVDLYERRVERVAVGPDPLGLALSSDGRVLYVASHRSGHPDRSPYAADPMEEERDITLIDTQTLEVIGDFGSVGTTLNGLLATPDRLYVSGLRNDTGANLADPTSPSFAHSVIALDPRTGDEVAAADLFRQPSSAGPAVSLHGMTLADGLLWVAAEGSDALVALDPQTLAEVRRVAAPGRPRAVLAQGERVLAHGAQGSIVSDSSGAQASTGSDARPAAIARGQRYFTGAGRDYGANWSCNSCHADGLGDTLIWNAGPFESRLLTRPLFWLEGSWPLGWAGYLSSVKNYAYSVNTNIGVRPTTAEATDLAAYIGSIMPPPAANAKTARDGGFSAQAESARALYDAKCGACHALPLTTSRAVLPAGLTEGTSAIPALVGAYRHGAWLKRGEARTLTDAVAAALEYLGEAPDAEEIAALTRFVQELTGRDFFVLDSSPRPDTPAAPDQAIGLTFSLPVQPDPANLAHVRLEGAEGPIDADLEVEGRSLTIRPSTALPPGQTYRIILDAALESEDERLITGATTIAFETAAAADLRLEGEYVWTVDMPLPRGDFSGFDPELTAATPVPLVASGGIWTLDYGADLIYETEAVVIAGDTLRLPPLPIPIGPSFSDSFGAEAQLEDLDGDGIADAAEGTVRISGPGFDVPGVSWRLSRPEQGCPEGVDGEPALVVERTGDGFELDWPGEETALGVYVTDPGVRLPLGPGATVTGGDTAWALAAVDFPGGFAAPVTYGVVPPGARDVTTENGGPAGGAPLEEGRCYQVSVITNRFRTATSTISW